MTSGMGISLSISKLRLSGLIFLALTVVAYVTKLVNTLSSMTLFITMGLTPFFDDVSPMMKLRNL
jgi:hypothetical protein